MLGPVKVRYQTILLRPILLKRDLAEAEETFPTGAVTCELVDLATRTKVFKERPRRPSRANYSMN